MVHAESGPPPSSDGNDDLGAEHFVRSFERGLRVIRAFGATSPEMTLAQVARATSLTRATVRRLLSTLVTLGYAGKREGSYFLLPRVLELGHAFMSSLDADALALPYMEQASSALNESSSLAVLDGSEVVYIARVPANRVMSITIGLGTRFPAYRTSLGRVLLMDRSDDELREVWDASDHSVGTPHTVSTFEEFLTEIQVVRRNGWCALNEELEIGVRAVAAPVRNSRGVVAAMSISTHASRTSMDDLAKVFVPHLLQATDAISAAFTNLTQRTLR